MADWTTTTIRIETPVRRHGKHMGADAPSPEAAPAEVTKSFDEYGNEQWTRNEVQMSNESDGAAWSGREALPLDEDGNVVTDSVPERPQQDVAKDAPGGVAESADDAGQGDAGEGDPWDMDMEDAMPPQNFESAWKRPSEEDGGDAEAQAEAGADGDEEYEDVTYEELAAKCEAQATLIERLSSQNARLTRQVKDVVSQFNRQKDDWQAYRRRTKGEVEQMKALAAERVAKLIFPVIDDIYRSVDHMRSTGDEHIMSLADGNEAIAARLLNALSKEGINPIRPEIGEPFDSSIHQAIALVEAEGIDSGSVAQVVQDGYAIGERVLRPAMVSVAK